jgi:hypothetical protein
MGGEATSLTGCACRQRRPSDMVEPPGTPTFDGQFHNETRAGFLRVTVRKKENRAELKVDELRSEISKHASPPLDSGLPSTDDLGYANRGWGTR